MAKSSTDKAFSTEKPVIKNPWRVAKRLLGYIKPVAYFLIFAFISFSVAAGANAGLVWAIEMLVKMLGNRTLDQIYLIPLAVIVFALARSGGNIVGQFSIQFLGRYLIRELRQALFHHLLFLPKKFFDKHSSSHISTRFSFHVEQLASTVANALVDLLKEGLMVVALLGYIIYLNWVLSLAFILALPFIAFVIKYTSRRLQKLSFSIQDSMAQVSHVVTESVEGQTVVRLFAGQDYEKARFQRVNSHNHKQSLKRILTEVISVNLVHLVLGVATAGLIWIAILQARYQGLEVSAFVAFITAAGMLVKPVKQLSQVNVAIQKALSAGYDLFKILDTSLEQPQQAGIVRQDDQKIIGKVEFRNLSFAYGKKKKVLQDISFIAKPGQLIALVGQSGSGKSTLISLIAQFYHHFTGDLLIDDQPIQSIKLTRLREHIAYVDQKTILFNDTIANNIAYGSLNRSSREKIEEAATLAQAKDFIEQLPNKMDTLIGEDGMILSAGQAQRIAIARALLKDAPILILDEPTSALDNQSEHAIKQALQKVMQNRTCFVIAHRLATIQQADLILVMQEGHIVESGGHQELLDKKSVYHELYNTQFELVN